MRSHTDIFATCVCMRSHTDIFATCVCMRSHTYIFATCVCRRSTLTYLSRVYAGDLTLTYLTRVYTGDLAPTYLTRVYAGDLATTYLPRVYAGDLAPILICHVCIQAISHLMKRWRLLERLEDHGFLRVHYSPTMAYEAQYTIPDTDRIIQTCGELFLVRRTRTVHNNVLLSKTRVSL